MFYKTKVQWPWSRQSAVGLLHRRAAVPRLLGAVDRSAVGLIFATRRRWPQLLRLSDQRYAYGGGYPRTIKWEGSWGGDKRSVCLGEAGAGGVVDINIPHGGHLHHTHPRRRGGRYRRGHSAADADSCSGGDWERGHEGGGQFHAVRARLVALDPIGPLVSWAAGACQKPVVVHKPQIIRKRAAVNFVITLLPAGKQNYLLLSPRRRKLRIQEFARFLVQCRHPSAFCFIIFYLCLGNSHHLLCS
jgi:hypothetical protein